MLVKGATGVFKQYFGTQWVNLIHDVRHNYTNNLLGTNHFKIMHFSAL